MISLFKMHAFSQTSTINLPLNRFPGIQRHSLYSISFPLREIVPIKQGNRKKKKQTITTKTNNNNNKKKRLIPHKLYLVSALCITSSHIFSRKLFQASAWNYIVFNIYCFPLFFLCFSSKSQYAAIKFSHKSI